MSSAEADKKKEAADNKSGEKTPPGGKTPPGRKSPSGGSTPRGTGGRPKTPPATSSTPAAAAEKTEEEKKREEEDALLLRPWLSPAKASILRKSKEEEEKNAGGGSAESAGGEQKKDAERSIKPAAEESTTSKNNSGGEASGHHHVEWAQSEPVIFPDHVFAAQRGGAGGSGNQQPQMDDVCERLYAEAVAKRRLKEEEEQRKERALAEGAADDDEGLDSECTFHPQISAAAASVKYDDWEQFQMNREHRLKQAHNRWTKKLEKHERDEREKAQGEDMKMAPMSKKVLEYKAKRGEAHKGPISNYDHYLGKFILKRTSPEKGADDQSSEERRRNLPNPRAQRELCNRLYEDAIVRVAQRQVVERALVAADKGKLFQPMTNERLLAKLKELNPDESDDSWYAQDSVETRLLSQGEAYRLRKERRRTQREIEATSDCTFTPRTNPKSRQLLQQWAKRVEMGGGGDTSSSQGGSVMRVDRNLAAQSALDDYTPLGGGQRGARVYTTEAEALAALDQEQEAQQFSSRKVVADPGAYFEKVKIRQANKQRELAEKRRQLAAAKEEGCTFRPAMAPLTVALAKIRDDKEFGGEAKSGHQEILMSSHMRKPTAEWGEKAQGSPRKLPGGARRTLFDENTTGAGAGEYGGHASSSSPPTHRAAAAGVGSASSSAHTSARRSSPRVGTGAGGRGMSNVTPRSARPGAAAATASSSSRHVDPDRSAQSEHFLADLEHELQGVISSWQNESI